MNIGKIKKFLDIFKVKNVRLDIPHDHELAAIKLHELKEFTNLKKSAPRQFSNFVLNSADNIKDFVNSMDTFIFDCDGVIVNSSKLCCLNLK